ncbi:MAG: hypothetical protein ACLFP8_06055 [Alphaproteobacteria bacterium]
MSDSETILKDVDTENKNRFFDFLQMCDDLEKLISRENVILLDKGAITFDGLFVRKINMLNRFERDIREILLLAKEKEPDNLVLRRVLVEKIQDVRRTLSINTTFQLRDLKKRTQRMDSLKNTLLDYSKQSKEGDTACH